MVEKVQQPIRIDLNEFKLYIDIKNEIKLTLHFDSPSRRFYLSLIAFVVNQMKILGKVTSIPLQEHLELIVLINKTVGSSAGSSEKENLLPRIYRKWKDALPNLEEAPLFRVLGRKREYNEGIARTYQFTETEKDLWANLFEYKGSGENVRLRFSIDKLGVSLDDVATLYEEYQNGEAWKRFLSSLKEKVENAPEAVVLQSHSEVPEAPVSRPKEQGTVLQSRHRRIALIAMVAVVLGVTALATWKIYLKPAPDKKASMERMAFLLPDKPSIAVLPFANMSGDPKEEYFCDGITDQIITSLSMIPRLFVIARDSTFVYKGKAVKVQKVAEDMGVRYVMEGSVQRTKDRVRILVQLIDAIKGVHLWSERYDRDLKDLFVLQDEIARQIMTALQVKLTEGEYASGIAGTTSNLKALEYFWRAEEHFIRFAKEDNAAARQWAQKAVELDPKFAGAWALMGWTHLWDVNFAWSQSPGQSMERSLECAQKAIGLSDSCAKAYALMGWINLVQRKFNEAIENGEKAVRTNPNDPMMLIILGMIMHFNGRFDESVALVKNAMRLCPYYPAIYLEQLSMSYFLAGRYEEALAAGGLLLDRAHKGEFSPLLAHICLAKAYIGLGQDQKARAHVEEMLKINPNFSLVDQRKMYMYRDSAHLERHIDALHKAGLK
jgi:TolB-like protein/Tfp pilus assembly protein PilF